MSTEITEYSQTEQALAELRQKYEAVVFDVTTTKGLQEAKAARAEVRTLRTSLEKRRQEIKAPALERCRLIDTEAKRITAALSKLEDPIDEAIKAEEHRKEQERLAKLEAERARLQAINDRIDAIRALPATLVGKPSVIIQGQLTKLRTQTLEAQDFEELLATAQDAHTAAIARIEEQLKAQQEHEAEAARIKAEREELERLREADRLRREEDERRAVEARAEADRLAAAERDRLAREERLRLQAIAETERVREQAAREAREEQEAAARRQREAEAQAQREEEARQHAAEEARLQAERERLAEDRRLFEARQAEQKRIAAEAAQKAETERRANLTLRDAARAAVDYWSAGSSDASKLDELMSDISAALVNEEAAAQPQKKVAQA